MFDFKSVLALEDCALELSLMRELESYTGTEIPNLGLDHLKEIFSPFTKAFHVRGLKVVTVAGTNGKGETCYTLAHLLAEAGKRVSVWSSPHILSVKERFIIENEFATHAEIHGVLREIKRQGLKLTYYEVLFYIFCSLVLGSESEVVIFEVGLGGRLDAVNLFDADLTLLTSISRDHTAILGRRYEQILREKLGVTRPGAPHLSALKSRYVYERQQRFLAQGQQRFDLFQEGQLSRRVSYREVNRLLALMARDYVLKGEYSFESATRQVKEKKNWWGLKGRFEKMTDGGHTFIFIGAHNTDGFRELVGALAHEDELRPRTAWVAFSAREDSELHACLKTLLSGTPSLEQVILTDFDHPKSWKLSQMSDERKAGLSLALKKFTKGIHVQYEQSATELLEAGKLPSGECTLVCGSYYFVGALERALMERGFKFSES